MKVIYILHLVLVYLLSKEFMTITVYAVDNLEVPGSLLFIIILICALFTYSFDNLLL